MQINKKSRLIVIVMDESKAIRSVQTSEGTIAVVLHVIQHKQLINTLVTSASYKLQVHKKQV